LHSVDSKVKHTCNLKVRMVIYKIEYIIKIILKSFNK